MAQPSYKQKTTREAYTVSFKRFYDTVNGCCTSLSKRKRKWVGVPIMRTMDWISESVLYLASGKIEGENTRGTVISLIDEIYDKLRKLRKPMYSLWAYKGFKTKRMQAWIDLMMEFARDLQLRYPDYKTREPTMTELFSVPKLNKYHKADFVDNMYKIHNQVLTYVANSSGRYVDSTQFSVVTLAREALAEVIDGNKIWAKNLESYQERRKKFLRALNLVKVLGTEVINHSRFHGYSDASINKWSKMISDERKLLNGILSSEKSKINKLQKEADVNAEEKSNEEKG